ncbi:hypothetical protein, partial [uncultured Phascolarctobacterium sp.]|uniref:hypothetical protein n=1 Tax=uncultured Phascolarctobacterium sp. TaxID=512296 RepID=UPI002615A192
EMRLRPRAISSASAAAVSSGVDDVCNCMMMLLSRLVWFAGRFTLALYIGQENQIFVTFFVKIFLILSLEAAYSILMIFVNCM